MCVDRRARGGLAWSPQGLAGLMRPGLGHREWCPLGLPSSDQESVNASMWNWKASALAFNRPSLPCGAWVLTLLDYKWAACDHPYPIPASSGSSSPWGASYPDQLPLRSQNHITPRCGSLSSHYNHFLHRHSVCRKGFPQLSYSVGRRPIL